MWKKHENILNIIPEIVNISIAKKTEVIIEKKKYTSNTDDDYLLIVYLVSLTLL